MRIRDGQIVPEPLSTVAAAPIAAFPQGPGVDFISGEPVLRQVASPLGAANVIVGPRGLPGADGAAGPQGPAGPAGATGAPGSSRSFVFNQSEPAAQWIIDHDLNKFPSVVIVDSAGDVCEGDIEYVSSSRVLATFCAAFGGVAYLN